MRFTFRVAVVALLVSSVRAIAQGRGVPLVDLHHALTPLPNRGISQDGIHPSVAPSGACRLTSTGLQYGYNVRNLLTLDTGFPLDRMEPVRYYGGFPLSASHVIDGVKAKLEKAA